MVRILTAVAAVLAASTVALTVRVVVDATTYSALSQQATACVAQVQKDRSTLQGMADTAAAIHKGMQERVPNDL